MMKQPSLFRGVSAGVKVGVAALALLAPLRGLAAQVPRQVTDSLRPAADTQYFRATVLVPDSTRLVLSGPAGRTREIRLSPAVIRRLTPLRGRSFTALAREHVTPGGIRAAVVLREGTTVWALAETVRDLNLLHPSERGGIQVELRPAEGRTLVYGNSCQTVYNVPTAFTIGGEQFLFQAYETRTVSVPGGTYTISLGASQFTVPKECPMVFEGSRSLIEYSVVRNR